MKKLIALSSLCEAVTGAALLIAPSLVVRLLLGGEPSGVAVPIARVTGIALIGLGIACWPGCAADRGLCGMLTYSSLVTIYLAYLGISGGGTGKLLWPAIILHAVLTSLLGIGWRKRSPDATTTS